MSTLGPSYDLALAFGADPILGPAEIQKVKDKRRQATLMMAGDVYPYFWTSKSTKTGNKGFDYLYFLYSGDADYAAYGVPSQFEGPCGMQNVKHLFGDGADHEAALGFTAARMSYQLPTPLETLVNIKSREELIGDIVALLQSPMKNVISALTSQGGGKIAGIVKTLSEKE